MKLQVTRSKVLLCVYDLNKIKRLFNSNKDGLVVELTTFSNAFGCETLDQNENRRNGLSAIDGQLLKPIFRKDILKQIAQLEEENRTRKKVRGEKRCNFIELGETPPEIAEKPVNARLFYVKNKNLCAEIEFFGFCGEQLQYKPSELPLKFDLPQNKFTPISDTFEIEVNVKFEKSSSSISSAAIDTLLQQLEAKELEVKKVKIDAYASIEGNQDNNHELFEQRAKSLIGQLNKYQKREIIWSVNAQENWRLFYDQIIGTKWFYLNSLSKGKIRVEVNKVQNQAELESLLAEQRTAAISIVVLPKLSDNWIFKLAKSEWEHYLKMYNPSFVNPNKIERMEQLQLYFYSNFGLFSSSQKQWVSQLFVQGYSDKVALLRYRQHLFNALENGVGEPIETVELLKKLNKVLQLPEIDYNIKSIIAEHAHLFDEKTKIPLIKSLMLQSQNDLKLAELYQELELWYHIEMANLVFGSQNKKNRNKAEVSLEYVREFYITPKSDSKDSIDLASFFILFDKMDWALELLKPIAFDSVANPNKKAALKLYLRNCLNIDLDGRDTEMNFVVMNAFEELGQNQWCRLFFTPCQVPYKVFDYPALRTLYCTACGDFISTSTGE